MHFLRSGEKEKYCRVTADLICAPIIMNFSSFPDLLHKSIDSLFNMCDHSEANIRMVAEENLNRVVRVSLQALNLYTCHILTFEFQY